MEATYQQARKEIEILNKSLSDLEVNRLSLDSLHEAEKLLQSVGYSVENQLAQDLNEIEGLNEELTKTENVVERYLLILTKLKKASKNWRRS